MKLIQICSIFLVFSTVLGDSGYSAPSPSYGAPAPAPEPVYAAPAAAPSYTYSDESYPSSSYGASSPDFDMDTILPIVVFGGLGLGALAYVDSLNRMNNICNKLRSVTDAARGTATDGATAATGGTAATDRIINSNREFINTLIAIDSLDC